MTFDVLNVMYIQSQKAHSQSSSSQARSCGVGECAVSADTVAEALLHMTPHGHISGRRNTNERHVWYRTRSRRPD